MSTFVDFETLTRPAKPNHYLIAPPGLCQNTEPDAPAPDFPRPASDLLAAIGEVISGEPLWSAVVTDTQGLRLRFVARTRLFRFKDDVDIAIIPTGEASAKIAIYSRSRLGYSDLGANRRRVEAILNKLNAK